MKKIAWIIIDNGDTFEGTEGQFRDTYFDNVTVEGILDFCEERGWKVEIQFTDGTRI
jgi:hypothetical protein